jgi:hypothetical protein
VTPRRYHIRIQRRCEFNGRYARDDWRAYREYLVWPITFPTYDGAFLYMQTCFRFNGITGNKLSACVELCK